MIARLLTTALAAASALGLGVAPALAQEPAAPDWRSAPRDWSETLRQDAAGLHAIIVDSHPGIHDERNPAFRSKVDEGLALALERARTTTDICRSA
jgi:hypothetical protein